MTEPVKVKRLSIDPRKIAEEMRRRFMVYGIKLLFFVSMAVQGEEV